MKAKIQDKNKCGIYLIRNLINGKVYIGKSKNIYSRIQSHISSLNRECKKCENEYFINSWKKYGKESFNYIILEECSFEYLKERELYWIMQYNSLDKSKGYNLRLDSESGMIPSNSTLEKYKKAILKRYTNPEERLKTSIRFKKFWKEHPEIKSIMAEKVKIRKQKYRFLQYDLNDNLIEVFENMDLLLLKYPHFKWQNIYSVCNGYKPTMYGYIWKKEHKI